MEALRTQWIETADAGEQVRIADDIQKLSFEEVPYYPIGQYKQPALHRADIEGIMKGTSVFWNVRRV
ncbi:hypothetical protein D3C73_843270 [compost metagenome]